MLELAYYGHSAFAATDGTTKVIFDPFLSGNPLNKTVKAEDIKVDYIFLSHVHADHLGDTVAIARNCDAEVICNFDVGCYLETKGVRVIPMHIGGARQFNFGRVKLTLAFHGNSVIENGKVISLGSPNGFLVTIGGKTIYHTGDTGLFYDMKLIGEMNRIDCALLPIGDTFTMGIDDALKAALFLNPGVTIPMHFNTFEQIKTDVGRFEALLKDKGKRVTVLRPGERCSI